MPRVITIPQYITQLAYLLSFQNNRNCFNINSFWVHINHGSMGHGYWPVTHVTHPNLLTHLAHDPLTRHALTLRLLALAREFGASIPQRVGPGDKTPQISHKNWGKELISTWISWKYHAWFSSSWFRRTPLWNRREMIFIFQKVKPTWNKPHLSAVYMAACLLHLRNTSLTSLLDDRRDRCHYLMLRKSEFLDV